jgi:hypothetical protein
VWAYEEIGIRDFVIRCIARSCDDSLDLGVGNWELSALILIRLLFFCFCNLILGYIGSNDALVPINAISGSFYTFSLR